MTPQEYAATKMIESLTTPMASGFTAVESDGHRYVKWGIVMSAFDSLSSGEQAVVELARHLGMYTPKTQTGIVALLGRVDRKHQQLFIELLFGIVNGWAT